MHFQRVNDLGKVIAIRLKRLTKNGRTLLNSTTTDHEGDNSIIADISNPVPTPMLSSIPSLVNTVPELGLEVSTNVSSARHSRGVSLAREASDMAQVALPFVQAIAGAIPLVGAPMQVAIGGLMTGLQAIDRYSQNKSDLVILTLRLNRLSLNLCNAPPAWDPVEQSRRDSFVRMLEESSARVTALHERCLASTSVTQAIAGCFIEIDRYLADYLLSSQIQSQHDMREELVNLRKQQEDNYQKLSIIFREQSSVGPSSSRSTRTVSVDGYVTLVDATGHHHPIPVNFCTSFQQLNMMLQVIFQPDSPEARIQRRYVEEGQYDLCIDEGKQVTQLTNRGWSSLEAGTNIVMRVIVEQNTQSFTEVHYQCSFCGAVNHLGVRSVTYSIQRKAGCSTDCRKCKRRFQITRKYGPAPRSSDSGSNRTTDAEWLLIRNFHIQQNKSEADEPSPPSWLFWQQRKFLSRARQTPAMSPSPGHVPRSYMSDAYHGSSGIEEIEEDSEDEEWDGVEEDSDEDEYTGSMDDFLDFFNIKR